MSRRSPSGPGWPSFAVVAWSMALFGAIVTGEPGPSQALASSPALAPSPAPGSSPAPQESPAPRDPRLQQAREMIQGGRLQEARELLRELLAARPDHGAARLLAGRAALATGDLDAAEQHLEAARGASPDLPFMLHHALGMLRLVQRDFERARQELGLALEAAPRFAPARLARARSALFLHDVDAARRDLESVASSAEGPTAAEATVLLGELDLLAGRGAEAMGRFRSVAGDPGSDEGPAPARMYLTTLGGSPEESEPRVRAWLGEHLNDAHAWFWLGVVTAARGDRGGARRSLSVALSIDDQHAPSYLVLRDLTGSGPDAVLPSPYPRLAFEMGRARQALAEGEPDRAEEIAARVLDVRPRFVPAGLLLTRAAELRGDHLEALLHLEELLDSAPELTSLLVHRADLARRVGALELAERSARAALERRPEDGSLHFLLGSILADAGRTDEAVDSLERAVELSHRTAGLYVTLGNLHHERQEIAAAVDAMQEAVELDPAAAGRIAGFALTAMTAEDQAAVRSILEGHLERDPDDVDALYTLGSLYLRQGELDAAREAFTRLRELAPERARVHYNLALVHRRQGDEAAADREMERFRQLEARQAERWESHDRAYRLRQRARDALDAGEPDRAVPLLEEILAGDAAEPGDHVLLGRALLRRGDAERALAEFRRALEARPYDPRALCGAADAATSTGAEAATVEGLERRARLLMDHPCPPDDDDG